jgi:hypothetical protein
MLLIPPQFPDVIPGKAESEKVADKAMKLIYFLPAPGFPRIKYGAGSIKHGMTVAGPRHEKKDASLFVLL